MLLSLSSFGPPVSLEYLLAGLRYSIEDRHCIMTASFYPFIYCLSPFFKQARGFKAGVLRQQWYMITIQQRVVKSSVSKQSTNVFTLVSVIDY